MQLFRRSTPPASTPAASWQTPEPAIFVIFGVTGNLATQMLLPALYYLVKNNLLHEHTAIVGVSRRPLKVADILKTVEQCVDKRDGECDPHVLAALRKRLSTIRLDPVNGGDYAVLRQKLNAIEDAHGMCMNRLFYLAIPPQVYLPVIENMGRHHLHEGCQHHRAVSRLLVEKPFGYDFSSAQELIRQTARYFSEDQVFRIDHYLAKETAQNLLVFRAANPLFTSLWNHRHVQAIELEFCEQIGVAGRLEFYDNVGALRDVVQNHLMQLLALTAMELPPTITNADAVHRTKRTLLRAVKTADPRKHPVLRGQYAGYQQEVKNPGSTTETYVRLQLEISNERWHGTPVTLTAGKALDVKQTAISLTFVDKENTRSQNRLTFRISPNEGIGIELTAKRPGFDEQTEQVIMDFSYAHAFGDASHPDAYERVLVDAIRGDHSLFASSDEVLESWRILQPILTLWGQSSGDDMVRYEPGSHGPQPAA